MLVLVAATVLAAALTAFQVPLTSGQAVSLPVKHTTGAVPLDPVSPAWADATPLAVPLTAQLVQIPQGGGHIPALTARAMFNDTYLAVQIEWRDATRDALTWGPEDFSDSVAIQIASTTDGMPPFVCMGQANFQTQIWHWKAERDPLAGGNLSLDQFYHEMYGDWYPFENESAWYPGLASGNWLSMLDATPVEVLVAGGAGTLASTDHRTVFGAGYWEAGTWRVVFVRTLVAANPDEVDMLPNAPMSVSFAAWDGSSGDRNGQKSVSTWYDMTAAVPGAGGLTDLIPRILLAVALIAVVLLFLLRRRRREEVAAPDEPRGLEEIADAPQDADRRSFLKAGGIVAAGSLAMTGPAKTVLGIATKAAPPADENSPDPEPDWPSKKRVIDDEFERGYRDPQHLR